jgi:hypothetical protein
LNTKSKIKKKFGWNLTNDFSIDQQKMIFETGNTILAYLDKLLIGHGKEWMEKNIGKINFHLGGLPQIIVTLGNRGKPTSVTFIANRIWLEPTFEQGNNPIQHVIHEVAHVIDNGIGSHHHALLPIWLGHGPSDQLFRYLGGTPKGLRWQNGLYGIPNLCRWDKSDARTQFGYGNHSTADNFAEAFAWAIVDPSRIKQPLVKEWIIKFLV